MRKLSVAVILALAMVALAEWGLPPRPALAADDSAPGSGSCVGCS